MLQTILLVDDDESNRITLSVLLEEEGFRVDVAESAAAVRALLARGGAPAYAAVLLDQRLGDGLGTDLLPLIRAGIPAARVVLVSGGEVPAGQDLGGFDGHLFKGIDFPDLLRRLRSILR